MSRGGCWIAATRWSASTTSTTTTIRRSSSPGSRSSQAQPRFALRARWTSPTAKALDELVRSGRISQRVVHLAAQAGVRYSLTNPHAYVHSNVTGFLNMLEAAVITAASTCVYASTSSVYGANRKLPFSEHDNTDHPVSLYAATKKSNELMAHTYSHLFGLPATGLRFFTVYGPWGRPDMSLALFTRAILEGRPIDVFNHGEMERDFTYIDDIVEGVVRVLDRVPSAESASRLAQPAPDPVTSSRRFASYNIGNNRPVKLMTFIETIERALGRTAVKNMLPMQPGDVPATYAEVDDLREAVGFSPEHAVGRTASSVT